MTFAKPFALALAALTIPAQPVFAQAQAQRDCVTEAEVSARGIYSVPHALRSVRSRCGANLAADGFLATQGNRLSQRYAALADSNWRGALTGITRMVGAGLMQGQAQLQLDRLPAEIVRPLVDEMIAQKVAEQVAPADCRRIERAAEAFAPLEPTEVGRISAVIMSLAGIERPKICTVS